MGIVRLVTTVMGEEEDVLPGVDLFAKQYGWTPEVDDGLGNKIPNPVSSIEHSNNQIKRFYRESVLAQVRKESEILIQQAQVQAQGLLDKIAVTTEIVG